MDNIEEDPAAAFLAREQDDLADIAEDTLGYNSAPAQAQPQIIPQGESDFLGLGEETSEPASSDPYSAVLHMDNLQAEPECLRKWREEQAEMLAKKDTEEEESLQELTSQAKVDLQEWYARHEEQLSQTKGVNRQAEAAFIEERDEDVPGHEWERVARLCDFNPKNSKNSKDVSRMRSIFLQLKQTPLVRS